MWITILTLCVHNSNYFHLQKVVSIYIYIHTYCLYIYVQSYVQIIWVLHCSILYLKYIPESPTEILYGTGPKCAHTKERGNFILLRFDYTQGIKVPNSYDKYNFFVWINTAISSEEYFDEERIERYFTDTKLVFAQSKKWLDKHHCGPAHHLSGSYIQQSLIFEGQTSTSTSLQTII